MIRIQLFRLTSTTAKPASTRGALFPITIPPGTLSTSLLFLRTSPWYQGVNHLVSSPVHDLQFSSRRLDHDHSTLAPNRFSPNKLIPSNKLSTTEQAHAAETSYRRLHKTSHPCNKFSADKNLSHRCGLCMGCIFLYHCNVWVFRKK